MNSPEILDRLEDLLTAAIPLRVKAIRISEPVYCLRIWYKGTDSLPEDRTPSLMLPKQAWRERMLAEKGEGAPHYIWAADEIDTFRDMVYFAEIGDPAIERIVFDWYAQMPDRELPDDNDLLPLRDMVRRVAARLNEFQWSKYATVTDDFVVMAADGSHSFVDDFGDMEASVPRERIDQFRSRRLLGGANWWTLAEEI